MLSTETGPHSGQSARMLVRSSRSQLEVRTSRERPAPSLRLLSFSLPISVKSRDLLRALHPALPPAQQLSFGESHAAAPNSSQPQRLYHFSPNALLSCNPQRLPLRLPLQQTQVCCSAIVCSVCASCFPRVSARLCLASHPQTPLDFRPSGPLCPSSRFPGSSISADITLDLHLTASLLSQSSLQVVPCKSLHHQPTLPPRPFAVTLRRRCSTMRQSVCKDILYASRIAIILNTFACTLLNY